jgi:tRNA dimethylallyltransferase
MSKDVSFNWYDGPDPARPPIAVIAGPTASGKSDCAVSLAQALEARGTRAVIINADSAQVYADLAVLSARPSGEEMAGIDHRLFGTWDGAQACSAAEWAKAATAQINDAHAAGAIPVLVGGTGLYIRTLLDGIAPVPPIDEAIRQAVRAMPVEEAYAALRHEDPQRADKLAPADVARVSRALEVVRSTGKTLGTWQAQSCGGIGARVSTKGVILLPDRAQLYARCDARLALMFVSGALEEIALLLKRGLDPNLPVMRAIGVAEIGAFLRGETDLASAQARASQATRNYAKRQYTWLRHQLPATWSRIQDELPFAQKEIMLRNFGLT